MTGGARSLADGRTKFTILTTKPVNPAAPTVTELNAGINAEDNILASDFTWSATDSDKVAEKALSTTNNANSLGSSNYSAGITVFRFFDSSTKNADSVADAVFAAVKTKGTELWCYARKTAKLAAGTWVTADEIYMGAHVLTDTPQAMPDGYIKSRVPMEVQEGYTNIAATT